MPKEKKEVVIHEIDEETGKETRKPISEPETEVTILEKVKAKIKERIPTISEEDLHDIALMLTRDLMTAEARKMLALDILHRAKKYIYGYLKDYKIEAEVVENGYPLELHIKVYF